MLNINDETENDSVENEITKSNIIDHCFLILPTIVIFRKPIVTMFSRTMS